MLRTVSMSERRNSSPAIPWPMPVTLTCTQGSFQSSPFMRGRVPLARIEPPDDELLAAVLAKQFSDRQITVPPRVIGYLAARMERSFAEAARLVGLLDALALADGRPVTIPLARRALRHYTDGEGEEGG